MIYTLDQFNNWQNMQNKVICTDALELLKQLPDKCVDLCLTDPPYRNMEENQPTKDMRNNGSMSNFGDKPSPEVFEHIFRVSKNQIIWGVNNFNLPPYKGFIVYKKKTISENFTMSMAEIAYLSEGLGTTSKVFECQPQDKGRQHPTQKPLKLFTWILKTYAKDCNIILDPFMGSWTTAKACQELGRNFIGCDLEMDYCRIGEQRLSEVPLLTV